VVKKDIPPFSIAAVIKGNIIKYRKKLMGNLLKCSLCSSIDKSKRICDYPGSFLNCTELSQCSECKLIFATPTPSTSELNNYYSSGLFYSKTFNPFNLDFIEFSLLLAKSRLRLISNYVDFSYNLKVIDIGAGNAQFSAALNELNHECVYDAVEPDEGVGGEYGELVNDHFNEINQAKKNTYDLAVLNQVLEHVADPVDFLSSVSERIKTGGYVYIDVPYKDYIFKPSVEPHILFWTQGSLKYLAEIIGLKFLFCDTAGMPHRNAKSIFHVQTSIQKLLNPWLYKAKINRLFQKSGLPKPFNTFRQFQSDHYGGDRQWLRCIAQKIN
jgi:2-polyprenyl-3-methyl-5-hydroxy-6-metoxy-1,4-benzoquinol methylase